MFTSIFAAIGFGVFLVFLYTLPPFALATVVALVAAFAALLIGSALDCAVSDWKLHRANVRQDRRNALAQ